MVPFPGCVPGPSKMVPIELAQHYPNHFFSQSFMGKWLHKLDLTTLWDLEFDYYYWMVYMKPRGSRLRYSVRLFSDNTRLEILASLCPKVMAIKASYCDRDESLLSLNAP